MNSPCRVFIINNIKLPIYASTKEAFSIAVKRLKSLGAFHSDINFGIYKRSIDARNKKDIYFYRW